MQRRRGPNSGRVCCGCLQKRLLLWIVERFRSRLWLCDACCSSFFCGKYYLSGYCSKNLPISCMSDVFDIQGVSRCEELFTVMEENEVAFKVGFQRCLVSWTIPSIYVLWSCSLPWMSHYPYSFSGGTKCRSSSVQRPGEEAIPMRRNFFCRPHFVLPQ